MANVWRDFASLFTPANLIFSVVLSAVLSVVGASLARPFATQRRYLARAVLHIGHLLHGHWLCPQCMGSQHLGTARSDFDRVICQFCLHLSWLDRNTPDGYVRFHRLMQDWDKCHWRQRVPAWVIPQQAAHGPARSR